MSESTEISTDLAIQHNVTVRFDTIQSDWTMQRDPKDLFNVTTCVA